MIHPEILFDPQEYVIRGSVQLVDAQWEIIAAALDIAAEALRDYGYCSQCQRFPRLICQRHKEDLTAADQFDRVREELKLLAKASRLAGGHG